MSLKPLTLLLALGIAASFPPASMAARLPGGGTGDGPPVTVTDHDDGTVTMANGIVAIVIVKATSRLNSVTYTYNNGGAPQTREMLQGKGQYYYGGFSLGNGKFEYTLGVDPATNGGNYADVTLRSDSPTNGVMETHFSLLRGAQGYYSTAIMTHRKQDAAFEVGAWGVVTRVPPEFNWLSADDRRNFFIGARSSKGVTVPNAPHEITVLLDGARAGEFADKFIYGQDHADLRAWGWSSVGKGGANVGIWMMTTMEFSNGGPLKRDVSVYPYSELNNSILTGELGMGSDGYLEAGEEWTKTCGPWFIYMNNLPATVTGTSEAAQALFTDARAQAEAEKNAWPYPWFKHEKYAQAAGRGTVKGKFLIADPGQPNASAAGLWVGLYQQPHTIKGYYDFQKWSRPYQYWAQTEADGSFTIPQVLAGSNYTLWAYGPGAPGMFLSQNLAGGQPPLLYNLPAQPFHVEVTGGATKDLGPLTWTPTRVGATVFELGSPNRKADTFRHSEDFWAPEKSPHLGYPTPLWGGQMYFPTDFPDGLNYTAGKGRWTTDWNYILPSLPDAAGLYQPCTGTITFNLAQAPASGASASLYLGCAGDDGGHILVSINGTDLDTVTGVKAEPNPLNGGKTNSRDNVTGGFNPPYSDNSSIHFGDHGPFSDERLTFPASLLHAGPNTIALTKNARDLSAYLMLDYLRLELTGYVPPAPEQVIAYAGNKQTLVRWPLVPGATSYNLLRATAPGSAGEAIATGKAGPVCGSGPGMMSYTDTTAVPGKPFYYSVQSVNPFGQSSASGPSNAVTSSDALSPNVPAPPAGLQVTGAGHHKVGLRWTAAPGADFYTVTRTTLYEDGVGGTYPLRTVLLDDAIATTSFTDTTPTDGKIYSYQVEAGNAAGASVASTAVRATPLPPPPAAAPAALAGKWSSTRQGPVLTLTWSPVPGASGYVIYRSTQPNGPFRWPEDFVTTTVATTYTDKNDPKKPPLDKSQNLRPDTDFYYQVTAVNVGGISPPATGRVTPQVTR